MISENHKTLELHFSPDTTPELFRLYFSHPIVGNRIAVRGKDSGAVNNAVSFQWTQAVKAFCVLCLNSFADSNNSPQPFALTGADGSLASSLDYAIAKSPLWLSEVFGLESDGKPFARKLFRRTNSDRKFGDTVTVALASSIWRDFSVAVFLDGTPVSSSKYSELAQTIELGVANSASKPRNTRATKDHLSSPLKEPKLPQSIEEFRKLVSGLVAEEFQAAAYRVDIFRTETNRKALEAISSAGFFERVAGKKLELAGISARMAPQEHRLGVYSSELNRITNSSEPLTVLTPSTLLGPLLLFKYLENSGSHNLILDYAHSHAVGLVRRMLRGEMSYLPDLFCCGLAPAASLCGSHLSSEYIPLMLLPDSSQKVISKRTAKPRKSGSPFNNAQYSYLKEEPSIPGFMLEELTNLGYIKKSNVGSLHHEPDESFAFLMEQDPERRAVLFFPHYKFNELFNDCEILPDPREHPNSQEVILFVHRRRGSIPGFLTAIEILVRDAWLDLRMFPELIKKTADSLLTPDEPYLKCVTRFSGLHALRDKLPMA